MSRAFSSRLIVFCLVASSAWPAVATEPAASGEPTVVKRVEGAIKRGASAAGHGIEIGVNAAASGVKRGASAVERGAKTAGGAIERTAARIGLPAASGSSAAK